MRLPLPTLSLRRQLLLGLLIPIVLLIGFNAVSLYTQALQAINTAYDRTLLASAKSIGEQLDVRGYDQSAELIATVPHAALEAFEADNQSRLYYRVSNTAGELVSGHPNLRFWRGQIPLNTTYAALVDFYDDQYQGTPVRVAVLLQPVAGTDGRGMAVIQVAETLELRLRLARQILLNTVWRQALLVLLLATAVVLVVQRATRPVRTLSDKLQARQASDLSPVTADDTPHELRPLLDATNQVMARLARLLAHQKRFVRDSSHQLRTPLAVLKAQIQSALRGDIGPRDALVEINDTVERATRLANQMLSLAKVEQLHQQGEHSPHDLAAIVREVALDLAPLIADKQIDFDIDTVPTWVKAHDWMLRELSRNLLHNAIKILPVGGQLTVHLSHQANQATLRISDNGPGIAPDLQDRLFQPFATGDTSASTGSTSHSSGNSPHGFGLGLTICQEIAQVLGGELQLRNRSLSGVIQGVDAVFSLSRCPDRPSPPPVGLRSESEHLSNPAHAQPPHWSADRQ